MHKFNGQRSKPLQSTFLITKLITPKAMNVQIKVPSNTNGK